MSSILRMHTGPKRRLVKLDDGRAVVVERIGGVGDYHYLVWNEDVPLTEVWRGPKKSPCWYSRGSGMSWTKTRVEAIQVGIQQGKPSDHWTPVARRTINDAGKRS